jgi:hypothetical protein
MVASPCLTGPQVVAPPLNLLAFAWNGASRVLQACGCCLSAQKDDLVIEEMSRPIFHPTVSAPVPQRQYTSSERTPHLQLLSEKNCGWFSAIFYVDLPSPGVNPFKVALAS